MDRLGEKPGRAEVLAGWLYHDRRLVRDVAETGGDDGDRSRRMGKKTRENVGAIATADGGLRLEVSGVRASTRSALLASGACGTGGVRGAIVDTVGRVCRKCSWKPPTRRQTG